MIAFLSIQPNSKCFYFSLMLQLHRCISQVLLIMFQLNRQRKAMQLEAVLLKYIPIFNYLGESCVMASDFQLTNHSSIRRRLTYISIFISFILGPTVCALNVAAFSKYYIIKTNASRAAVLIILICITATKLFNISQMHSWLNDLPKMYRLFKELQVIAGNRYEMDFRRFHIKFIQKVITITSIILAKFIIIAVVYKNYVISLNEALVLSTSYYIAFFHVYFYVSLFKNLMSFYVSYVERKSIYGKPKTLSDIKIEFFFIKATHLKLYEISRILNASFGWIFVSIAIQKFIEIVGALFFTFLRSDCVKMSTGLRNYWTNSFCFSNQLFQSSS